MFSLYKNEKDILEFEDKLYRVNASFDTILKVIELFEEEKISDLKKLDITMKLLFGKDTDLIGLETFQKVEIYNLFFEKYLKGKQTVKAVTYDRLGNVMPEPKSMNKASYSLKYDAQYIYASFMQAYRIDLLEQQGKLHWFKFSALLNGLPEDTKFRQVVSIRLWKETSENDYESNMRELQALYALPDQKQNEEEEY